MATDDIERLHYYQRQYLGAQDFEDQQAYHRDMRRRHNLAHHTWGIVTGLELKQVPKTGTTNAVDIYITPGMAIDGYGREIVVLQPTSLDPTHFLLFRDQQVRTVCLEYLENFAQRPQQGYQQCDVVNQFGRVQESFNIVVADPNPPFRDDIIVDGKAVFPQLPVPSFSGPDPEDAPIMPLSSPSSQLANDLIIPFDESIPYQEFPTDDPSALIIARWLIPLGKVIWNGTVGNQQFMQDTTTPPFLTEGRHYIGTVASRIFAPAGKLIVRDRNTVLPFKSSTQLKQPATNESQSPANTKTSQTTTNTTSNTSITGTAAGNINVASTSNSTSSTSTPQASAGGSPASSNTPQAATGASPADTGTSSDGVAMIIEGTLEVDRALQVHGPLEADDKLQVDGIVTAKNNIQLWGGQLDFRDTVGTSDGRSSTDPLFTISRQGTDTTTGISLRATIGKDSNGKNRFVVGPVGTEQFWITDDGNAHLTGSMDGLSITGTLSFGSQPRQMIQLWSSKDQSQQNGIGVQVGSSSATTYFRSSNDFCWFKGGIHNDTPDSPGGGGKLQLKLDQDGSLHFDQDSDANQRWRQMLNLSSTKYGIGVQDSTLYFRSDADFCWFQGGSPNGDKNNAGGGTTQLRLDQKGDIYFSQHSGQMLNLGDTLHGIGVQPSTLYLRSDADFCWYRGGTPSPNQGEAGNNGQLQLKLDQKGDLYFSQHLGQMLNLWQNQYGIGVQNATLYFRSETDFCWFRGGSHADAQGNTGGGAMQMRLNMNGSLDVFADQGGHVAFVSNHDKFNNQPFSVTLGYVSPPGPNHHDSDSIYGFPNLWLDTAGTVYVKSGMQFKAMDGAEYFPHNDNLQPGDVVVLSTDGKRFVKPTENAYDTAVAGVVSTNPAFILGGANSDDEREPERKNSVPVALIGTVLCKVDADIAPIHIGDLLTTSPTKGHAQKVVEPQKAIGAVLGKAMENLEQGQGIIPILVMLS